MKKIISFLFSILLIAGMLNAQQISFGYDAAGNQKTQNSKQAEDEAVVNEQLDRYQLKIYPNPTKGMLAVEITGITDDVSSTVSIYSMQGLLVSEQNVTSTRIDFDLSSQPSGTYIMKVVIGTKNTMWTIIKE